MVGRCATGICYTVRGRIGYGVDQVAGAEGVLEDVEEEGAQVSALGIIQSLTHGRGGGSRPIFFFGITPFSGDLLVAHKIDDQSVTPEWGVAVHMRLSGPGTPGSRGGRPPRRPQAGRDPPGNHGNKKAESI